MSSKFHRNTRLKHPAWMHAALICLVLFFVMGMARADDGITLNFKDADIREVAASIGTITHKNFIIDPRVQGRVTVISSKPVSAGAVYAAFLSVLQVYGLAAVRRRCHDKDRASTGCACHAGLALWQRHTR